MARNRMHYLRTLKGPTVLWSTEKKEQKGGEEWIGVYEKRGVNRQHQGAGFEDFIHINCLFS